MCLFGFFLFCVFGLTQLAKLAKNNPADTVKAVNFVRQMFVK